MSNHAWTPKHFLMCSATLVNSSQYYMLFAGLHITEGSTLVENEDVGLGQGGHELHIAAIAFGEWELLEEPGETQGEHRPTLAAGLMPKGAREPGFALLMTIPSWG